MFHSSSPSLASKQTATSAKNRPTQDAFPLLYQSFKIYLRPMIICGDVKILLSTLGKQRYGRKEKKWFYPALLIWMVNFSLKLTIPLCCWRMLTLSKKLLSGVLLYFAFKVYPSLKFVFGFFERLIGLKPTTESVNGKKLHGFF